jgi:hypothetical protein
MKRYKAMLNHENGKSYVFDRNSKTNVFDASIGMSWFTYIYRDAQAKARVMNVKSESE